VERVAARLQLVGWVANDSSGSVILVVEGDTSGIDHLAAELWKGPSGAVVERVDSRFAPPTGQFRRFEIRAGGHPGD